MGQVSIDKGTAEKIDKLREETGAQTRGEVIRNAIRVYLKDLAYEKREAAESAP
jgi:metal-responsive CopG/Arc/MetJ family transcriptional regulator